MENRKKTQDWVAQNERTPQVNVKFKTPEQHKKALTAAARAGMTVPEFIRHMIEKTAAEQEKTKKK